MSARCCAWRPTWVACLAGLPCLGMSPNEGDRDASPGAAVLSRLPLAFVENRGQWDTPARFVARRGGMTARIEKDGIVLQLARRAGDGRIEGVVARLRFEGERASIDLEGEGKQPGAYNFFLGNDPSGWRTGVPAYASVLYRGLREGVDLRIREEKGRLEYDLLLAPGADAEGIVVRCEGIEGIEVEPDGSLAMATALGPIRQSPPVAWQALPGGGRRPIEARFRRLGPERFGFVVPGRDPSLPLVIDPGLLYSTFLGGFGDESVEDIAVDATGAATVAGSTVSAGFPTTAGAFNTTAHAGGDAFVARLTPSGNALVFSTYLGGSTSQSAQALALDVAGSATVAGITTSADFPATAGAFDTTFGGGMGGDGFVARLSPAGDALVYCTFLGGTAFDWPRALALDATGAATVAGQTISADFPSTASAFDSTFNGVPGFYDAFVTRVSPSGNALLYSTFLGGTSVDRAVALALEPNGSATVAGQTQSFDFPATAGAYDTTSNAPVFCPSCFDGFVARLDPTGAALLFATYLGGPGDDFPEAIALDATGAATVAGSTENPTFPTTPGAYDTTAVSTEAFVTRLSPPRSALVWSTYLGGLGADGANAIAVDPTGAAVVAGTTSGGGFPATPGAYDTTFNGGLLFGDAFLARLSPSGNALHYSTFLGGSVGPGLDQLNAVALDVAAGAAVGGRTQAPDFPTTPGTFDTTFGGAIDAFVARLDLFPAGASPYGASTAGCAGPLPIGVNSIPQVGNSSFAITCGNGPASAFGFFGVSGAGLAAPLVFNGLAVWIDPFAPLFFEIVVPSDAVGAALVPIPVPANPALAGAQLFFQFAWFDACAPGGFSASNALAVVVQP